MKLNDPNVKPFPHHITDGFKVLSAALEAEKAGEHEFTCPVCGGKASWARSEYNGHISCRCSSCNSGVIE